MVKTYGRTARSGIGVLLILFSLLSCNKADNKENCYICTTTYTITTDSPVTGYPATTSIENELCDMTPEQIEQFEQENQGGDSQVVGGVTYTDHHSTKCVAAR